jgi:autotransporter-associated beta strand protein
MIFTQATNLRVGATQAMSAVLQNSLFIAFWTYLSTTISRVISGSVGLIKHGSGILTLSGNNTFTNGVTILDNGILTLANANAAGTGTIFLKSTQTGAFDTLRVNGGLTIANPISIDSSTGREGIASTGMGNTSLTGGIAITTPNTTTIFISNSQTSGNLTVSGGINGSTFLGSISLRGTQAGNTSFLNGVITLSPTTSFVDVNATGNWILNTAGSTYVQTAVNGTGSFVLGVNNALATSSFINFFISTSTGSVDLNGYNQSVGGLASTVPTTGNGGRIVNNGSLDSVLTISSMTGDRTFNGTIVNGSTNNISVVMNSAGRTQIFNRANGYTGATSIIAGVLRIAALISGPAGKFSQANFTSSTLSITFSTAPLAGEAYRLLPGATTQTYASVTLIGAPGRTATYNSANSTLTIA